MESDTATEETDSSVPGMSCGRYVGTDSSILPASKAYAGTCESIYGCIFGGRGQPFYIAGI